MIVDEAGESLTFIVEPRINGFESSYVKNPTPQVKEILKEQRRKRKRRKSRRINERRKPTVVRRVRGDKEEGREEKGKE